MSDQVTETFNWELYEGGYTGGTRLVPNKTINGLTKKTKVFSREPYAQKLFDLYTGTDTEFIKKDLRKGDVVRITDILNIKGAFIDIELAGGLMVTIDLAREKKFIQIYGYSTPDQFTDALRERSNVKELINTGLNAYILESTPSVKISLWQGHLKFVRDEFMQQITNPNKAYNAKVIQANRGGFFVEVQGIEAFMPGSLAAPNKIVDFQSYVGKEILVMVEDFLKDMNSFIVSHKKYLAHILPIKIQELDTVKKYLGTITGTSKFGIFLEFEGLFTGLLHTSKMDVETRQHFNSRSFKAGDEIDFYISEITKDNRIILTKESPGEKLKKIETFIIDSKDKVMEASVAAVMNFGIIISLNDLNGLIPIKEMKKHKIMTNFVSGDKIKVIFDSYENDKLVFKLPIKK